MCGGVGESLVLVLLYCACLVSFLALQSSRWGKDSWLFYIYCLLEVAVTCSVLCLPHCAVGWSSVGEVF